MTSLHSLHGRADRLHSARRENAILAAEALAYNSPVIRVTLTDTMEKPKKIQQFNNNLALTKEERMENLAVGAPLQLNDLEREVREGWQEYEKHELSALAVAKGIIRNVKLIRAGGDWKKKEANWDNYCQKHLGFSRQHYSGMESYLAKRSALSAKTQKFLRSGAETASVVEAISEVPEDKQEEVAEEAAKSGKKVTAKAVKEAAKKVTQEPPKEAEFRELIKDAAGNEVPENRVEKFKLAEKIGKENRQKAKEILNALESDDVLVVEARGLAEVAKDLHAGLGQNLTRHVMCPKCEWKGCSVCHKRGFVSKYFADKGIGK